MVIELEVMKVDKLETIYDGIVNVTSGGEYSSAEEALKAEMDRLGGSLIERKDMTIIEKMQANLLCKAAKANGIPKGALRFIRGKDGTLHVTVIAKCYVNE